jgi:hypothetical protein
MFSWKLYTQYLIVMLPAKLSGFKVQNKLLQQSLFTKSKLKYNRSPKPSFIFWQSGFSKRK